MIRYKFTLRLAIRKYIFLLQNNGNVHNVELQSQFCSLNDRKKSHFKVFQVTFKSLISKVIKLLHPTPIPDMQLWH